MIQAAVTKFCNATELSFNDMMYMALLHSLCYLTESDVDSVASGGSPVKRPTASRLQDIKVPTRPKFTTQKQTG